MGGARWLLVALALTQAGCGPLPPSPSPPGASDPPNFVRRIVGGDGTTRRLLVYDPGELLSGVRAPVPLADQRGNIWWDPVVGDPRTLVLGWLGGVCGIDPTLRVEAGESLVSLTVYDGHNPPGNDVCPATATIYGLALTFRERISNLDVSVELIEEPQ